MWFGIMAAGLHKLFVQFGRVVYAIRPLAVVLLLLLLFSDGGLICEFLGWPKVKTVHFLAILYFWLRWESGLFVLKVYINLLCFEGVF